MKRISQKLVVILLIVLLLQGAEVSATTSQEQKVFLPIVMTSPLPVIVPDTTKVLSEDITNYLVAVAPDLSTFTFSQTTPELADLEPGDVVVSGPSATAPYGFLRRVTDVVQSNSQVQVSTEFASLTDAVEQGSFHLTQTIDLSNATPTNVAEGVTITPLLSPSGESEWYVDVNVEQDCFKITGSFVMHDLNVDIGGEIHLFQLEKFWSNVTLNIVDDLSIEVVCEFETGKLNFERSIGSIILNSYVVPIGPVPLVTVTTVDLVVGAESNLILGAKYEATIKLNAQAGISYEQGNWLPSVNQQFDGDINGQVLKPVIGYNGKGYLGPEVQTLFYGIGGFYARLSGFLELEVNATPPGVWQSYYGLEFPMGAELDILTREIDEYEVLAIDHRWLWSQGSGEPSSPTPTSTATPSLSPTATPTGPTPTATPIPPSETTIRVSVSSDGTQGNGLSAGSSISADGRYIAFHSDATNLVSGDINGHYDIFVYDRNTGQITRVSVSTNGTEGNYASWYPSISADGRYIAFHSYAANLVSGDTNGRADVFVHDLDTGQTTRVSVASDGTQGNDESWFPAISADGRYVVFSSQATNLVSGDTNGAWDIFIHDLDTGQTTRVSVASDGAQGNGGSEYPSISSDGRSIAFQSDATNLVSGDTNGEKDVYVRDRVTGQTTRVSVASDGTQGNGGSEYPSISSDGRSIAFQSYSTNLVSGDTSGLDDIFVRDRVTGQTTQVSISSDGSQGNSRSWSSSISANGRYVAFSSQATNLVSGDTNGYYDIFVHDLDTGQTTRVSVASDGTQGNNESWVSAISADGRYVAFMSDASNLVNGDTNDKSDIFVRVLGSQ
jgi:Tol biopolymer transport system component